MPIYEFYCPECHVLLSFLSRRVAAQRVPACPRCEGHGLTRRPSAFAISKNRPDTAEEDIPGLDDDRLDQAMAELAGQAARLENEDPRKAAQVMQDFITKAGMPFADGMQEALARIARGEDPDTVEAELGDVLDEDPFAAPASKTLGRLRQRILPPTVDPKLYEM